ncbi:PREDICTED: probable F-box protein At4g22030 [Ipomoea nil]|uniref:probable F-box protein At4g22030 n=1 Tax=Ipomoea nil TaxID=35883 RepID=UPI000900E065|nr:PREDICTED: probable F-box protein At4g22030 [Ipomoea nil]
MATLQASTLWNSSSATAAAGGSTTRRKTINAALNFPKIHKTNLSLSLPILRTRRFMEEIEFGSGYTTKTSDPSEKKPADPLVVAKLYAILEAVADRAEMHSNVCEQRNNWNSLLLTSVNGLILAAATMAGISAAGPALPALKLSSTLLYLSATGMLVVMNKIQPSQLAEEQRNAARLFRNLHSQIQTTLSAGHPTNGDVSEAMQRVLALDKAYPLPLLGAMLEKFPAAVAPAVWWPDQPRRQPTQIRGTGNDWNGELEEDMREVIKVMKIKDREDYLRLGKKALKLNKALAISGPVLTGLAAVGASLAGPSASWAAAVVGVAAGALAAVVNTLQHGGQVGMVFEMYRSNAGFFKLVQDSIDSNIEEKDLQRRENGELFEMKVALKLGRSLSELKDLAAKSRSLQNNEEIDEFASKLF